MDGNINPVSRVARVKPYLYQLVGRVIPQIIAFAISISLVRISGLPIVGQYAVAIAISSVTFALLAGAIDTHILRRSDSQLLLPGILAKGIVWIAMLPLALWLLWRFGLPLSAGLTIYVALLLTQVSETVAIAARLRQEDVRGILPRVFPPFLFLLGILIFRPADLRSVAILLVLSWLFALLPAHSLVRRGAKTDLNQVINLMVSARFIGGSLFLTQIYGNADMMLVTLFLGDASAGLYKLAVSLSAVVFPAIGVLSFIYLSKIGHIAREGSVVKIRDALRKQIVLNAAAGIVFVIALLTLLPTVLPLLYGVDAKPAVEPSVILGFAAAINALSMAFSYTLLAYHRDRMILIAAALVVVVNIPLNLVLIPIYGISGAAIAGATSQVFSLAVLGTLARRVLGAPASDLSAPCVPEGN